MALRVVKDDSAREQQAALVAAFMLDPRLLATVDIDAIDFTCPKARATYEAMRALDDRDATVDLITIVSELRDVGTLEQVGGAIGVCELADADHGTTLAREYAYEIREARLWRELRDIGDHVAADPSDAELNGNLQHALDALQAHRDGDTAAPLFGYWAGDAHARTDTSGLVRGLLDHGVGAVLYAQPAMSKTFLAIELGMSIARGSPFFDLDTDPGLVVHVVGEGQGGFAARLDAYKRVKCKPDEEPPYWVHPEPVNLRDQDAVERFIRQMQRVQDSTFHVPLRLITFDTWNLCLCGGDENSSVDTGAAVLGLTRIRAALETSTLVIHHSGKDESKGARGHSLLFGNADTELKITRDEAQVYELRTTKQRDLEDSQYYYTTAIVDLGLDDEGESLRGSLIIKPCEEPERREPKRFTPSERMVLDAIQATESQSRSPETDPDFGASGDRSWRPREAIRLALVSRHDLTSKQAKNAFYKGLIGLQRRGLIEIVGDLIMTYESLADG